MGRMETFFFIFSKHEGYKKDWVMLSKTDSMINNARRVKVRAA